MSKLVRFSVSIEQPLFDKLEALVEGSDYTNRSEFIRDMIRNHLVEQQWAGESELLGTITLLFDHHVPGLTDKLTRCQHDFIGEVMASTHLHLTHQLCAEMIMVRGRGSNIKLLADRLRREKGVLHAQLSTSTTGRELAWSDGEGDAHAHGHSHDHAHGHGHDHDHSHEHTH